MNRLGIVAALTLALVFSNISFSHAGMVRFRVDVEVTRAFTGVPLGSTGTVTVQYDEDLTDQRTSEPFHSYFGLYGYPETPPVTALWDFGGNNAVYSEQGSITVSDAPFAHAADIYAVGAGGTQPEGITKGVFQNAVFRSGAAIRLTDTDGVMIGGETLVLPDASFIPLAEFNQGEVAFFGPSAFVGHVATDITLLDVARDASAVFTAGSPASLSQPIATPDAAFDIQFDVSFDASATTGGGLQIFLDGALVGSVAPSAAGAVVPITFQVADSALLGLDAAELVFQYDGPTGSTMTLDNIAVPGSDLLNGDFETQSLAAWAPTGPGAVGVQLADVPEPTAAALAGAALALLGSLRRWRP